MKRSHFAAALCAVVALMFVAQPIFAQKAFLDKLKEVYPTLDAKLAKCTTCHAIEGKDKPGKKNLNAYGKELQSTPEAKVAMGKETKGKYTPDELTAVVAGIKAIGTKTSGSNGKTNDVNLKAGVNPGK
jgi:cytochrome c553